MVDGTATPAASGTAPAATPVEGAPASTVVEPKGAEPSISDIMSFDPFAPAKEEPKPGDTKPADTLKPGADGKTPPPAEKPATKEGAAAPEPAKAAPSAQPDIAKLIQDQTAAILATREKPAAPAKAEPEAPKFNLGVPEPLVNAMASEDPKERGAALNAVVSGVANHVWNEVQQLVRAQISQLAEGIPNVIAAHHTASTTQQRVAQDFFGTYEMFKGEGFVPILQAAAANVAQEWQGASKPIAWNEEFRDAVAEKMFAHFPMLRPTGGTSPASKGNGGQPKIPFSTGGGSRQPAESKNEFEDILNST